jgi:hypothetical protein
VFTLLLLCSLRCCAMVWQGTASSDGRWQYLANFAYAVSRDDVSCSSSTYFSIWL